MDLHDKSVSAKQFTGRQFMGLVKHQQLPVRPFVLRLQPFEDEGFQSYFRRCMAANVIPRFGWISSALGIPYVKKFRPSTIRREVLANLSCLLGLDDSCTYNLMHRGYVEHNHGKRRVSPRSLQTASYDRTIWNVLPLPYCPHSLELLIDKCPQCEADLHWRSTLPIELCQNCLEDLRRHCSNFVPEEQRKLAVIVAKLLSAKPSEQASAISNFPQEFSNFHAQQLFDAGLQLGRITAPGFHRNSLVREWHWELHRAHNSTSGLNEFLSGFGMLMSWPSGFQQFLENAREHRTVRDFCTMMANLRSFALEGRYAGKFGKLILEQLPPLIGKERRQPSEYANDCKFDREYDAFRAWAGLITHREAADYLGLKMQFLADAKRLGHLPESVPGVRGTLFRKIDLDRIHAQLSDRVPISQAKRSFGLSSLALEQLLAAGMLSGLDHTIIGLMNEGPFVLKRELTQLIGRICGFGGKAVPAADLVSVGAVMCSIGCRDKPWATLIMRVLAGDIAIYPGVAPTIALDTFRVRRADLPAIQNMTFLFDQFSNFERNRALSGPEWAEYLNIGKPAKELIVKEMLLPVDISSLRYVCPLDAVVTFASRYISIWEIRARLALFSMPLPTLRERLHRCGLPSKLGTWFWCREKVLQNLDLLAGDEAPESALEAAEVGA